MLRLVSVLLAFSFCLVAQSSCAQSGSGLAVSPSALAFGPLAPGEVSAARNITVTNNQASSLEISYAVSNNNFTAGSGCATTLASAGSCQIQVTYSDASVARDSGSLVITPAGGASVTVPLTGSTVANTGISLTTDTHNFGDVTDGSSAIFGLDLTNNSSATAVIGFSNSGNPYYTVESANCPTHLHAKASCEVDIKFTPGAATGAENETLTITSSVGPILPDGAGSGSSYSDLVNFTAAGVAINQLTATSVGHDFGVVEVGTSATDYGVELSNNTAAAIPLLFSGLLNTADSFSVIDNNCPANLAPGANCEIVFGFTPTAAGTLTATYPIYSGQAPLYSGRSVVSPEEITLTGGMGVPQVPDPSHLVLLLLLDESSSGNAASGQTLYDSSPSLNGGGAANNCEVEFHTTAPIWSNLGLEFGNLTGNGGAVQSIACPSINANKLVKAWEVGFVPLPALWNGNTPEQESINGCIICSSTNNNYPVYFSYNQKSYTYGGMMPGDLYGNYTSTSFFGHTILGITCGAAGGSPTTDQFWIDGLSIPIAGTYFGTTYPCFSASATGMLSLMGGGGAAGNGQTTPVGYLSVVMGWSVQEPNSVHQQAAAWAAWYLKERGYTRPILNNANANAPTSSVNVACDGGSICSCYSSPGKCFQNGLILNKPFLGQNAGIPSVTASGFGGYAAQSINVCPLLNPAAPFNIVHFGPGSNDILYGYTIAQISASLTAGVAALHNCPGHPKVALMDMLSRGTSSACGQDAANQALNAYEQQNWQSVIGADYFEDWGATKMANTGGCANFTNYLSDFNHTTLTGRTNYLFPVMSNATNYLSSSYPYPQGFTLNVKAVSTYQMTANDVSIGCNASGNNVALTLPDATGYTGNPFWVMNTSPAGTANTCTVVGYTSTGALSGVSGVQLIGGSTAPVPIANGAIAEFVPSVASYRSGGDVWIRVQ